MEACIHLMYLQRPSGYATGPAEGRGLPTPGIVTYRSSGITTIWHSYLLEAKTPFLISAIPPYDRNLKLDRGTSKMRTSGQQPLVSSYLTHMYFMSAALPAQIRAPFMAAQRTKVDLPLPPSGSCHQKIDRSSWTLLNCSCAFNCQPYSSTTGNGRGGFRVPMNFPSFEQYAMLAALSPLANCVRHLETART